jgi:hypothetical protein
MNRQKIITAIIEAAREPVPEIRRIIQFKYPDERQQYPGGIPSGTTTAPGDQVVGYAFANPQGLLYGRIEYTREDLVKRHNEEEDKEMDDLRAQLERLNDAELQSQAGLWLNHGSSQQSTLTASEYNRQDRERDARLWRMMCARRREPIVGAHSLQVLPGAAEATAARHDGCLPASADRLDDELPPRFHDSYEAKHSLLLWLSERPGQDWAAFIKALTSVLSQVKPAPCLAAYLCASPRDVATAADEALRDSGLYRNAQSDNMSRVAIRTAAAAA